MNGPGSRNSEFKFNAKAKEFVPQSVADDKCDKETKTTTNPYNLTVNVDAEPLDFDVESLDPDALDADEPLDPDDGPNKKYCNFVNQRLHEVQLMAKQQLLYDFWPMLNQAWTMLSDEYRNIKMVGQIITTIENRFVIPDLVPDQRAIFYLVRGLYTNVLSKEGSAAAWKDFQCAVIAASDIKDFNLKTKAFTIIIAKCIDSQLQCARYLINPSFRRTKIEKCKAGIEILKTLPEGTPGVPELMQQANKVISGSTTLLNYPGVTVGTISKVRSRRRPVKIKPVNSAEQTEQKVRCCL